MISKINETPPVSRMWIMPALTAGTEGPMNKFIGAVTAIVRLHKSGCYGSADVAMHDIAVALRELQDEEERERKEKQS